MKQVIFGEMVSKEREGAWDKRVEERRDILVFRKRQKLQNISARRTKTAKPR